MSEPKPGRPPLAPSKVGRAKRQVNVAQMDFQKLEEAYQQLTGNPSKSIWDASGKLSSKAVSEILELFAVMASESGGKKRKKAKIAVPEKLMPSELAKDAYFQHAVARCGVNAYEELQSVKRKNWAFAC